MKKHWHIDLNDDMELILKCKHCGSSNYYESCIKCTDWKEKLQEKPHAK